MMNLRYMRLSAATIVAGLWCMRCGNSVELASVPAVVDAAVVVDAAAGAAGSVASNLPDAAGGMASADAGFAGSLGGSAGMAGLSLDASIDKEAAAAQTGVCVLDVQKLSDDSVGGLSPDTQGGKVAWVSPDGRTVYRWDGQSVQTIARGPERKLWPRIVGDRVFWVQTSESGDYSEPYYWEDGEIRRTLPELCAWQGTAYWMAASDQAVAVIADPALQTPSHALFVWRPGMVPEKVSPSEFVIGSAAIDGARVAFAADQWSGQTTGGSPLYLYDGKTAQPVAYHADSSKLSFHDPALRGDILAALACPDPFDSKNCFVTARVAGTWLDLYQGGTVGQVITDGASIAWIARQAPEWGSDAVYLWNSNGVLSSVKASADEIGVVSGALVFGRTVDCCDTTVACTDRGEVNLFDGQNVRKIGDLFEDPCSAYIGPRMSARDNVVAWHSAHKDGDGSEIWAARLGPCQ